MSNSFFFFRSFLLFFISLPIAWYSWQSLSEIHKYFQLRDSTPAYHVQWNLSKAKNEQYYVQATYVYKVKNNLYKGAYPNNPPSFTNYWAADAFLKDFSKKNWTAWFDPSQPQISQLEKIFPYKSCIYTFLLSSIWIYFFFLGYYIEKQNFNS